MVLRAKGKMICREYSSTLRSNEKASYRRYQENPCGEQGHEIRQERGSLLSEIIFQEKEKGMHAGQMLLRKESRQR